MARHRAIMTVNVSRDTLGEDAAVPGMSTPMEICLELDCQPWAISLKIVTDEEFDRPSKSVVTGRPASRRGLRRDRPSSVNTRLDLDLGE